LTSLTEITLLIAVTVTFHVNNYCGLRMFNMND